MKKVLLFFAAICCTAMMQAEIVYHAKCEPTRQRGFTQDCWEDTETGNIYSDQACTNELNAAQVVQYSKLANDPVITSNYMDTYERLEQQATSYVISTYGACLMGDVTHEDVQFHHAIRIYHSFNDWANSKYDGVTCDFQVTGINPRNARLKMYVKGYNDARPDKINFFVNINSKLYNDGKLADGFKIINIPQQKNLKYGDVISFGVQVNSPYMYGKCKYTTIDVCLEYEADSQLFITAEDKDKFVIGGADPVLTWTQKGNLLDGEKVNVTLSRTAGETPGKYPIHVTYQTENLGSDVEIVTQDATLTIFDGGTPHYRSEPTESQIGYAQDCWEDRSTGKLYLDGYHTQEVSPAAMILYPKFAESQITQNNGFTIKESETYGNALFNWVAVTNYGCYDTGTRFVEFTAHGVDIANARLKWFKDQGAWEFGEFNISIYVNGEKVQDYSGNPEGLFAVPLPLLRNGDIVKFEVSKSKTAHRADANPTIAACLEYTRTIGIKPDDKRKFKGVEDPELTYTVSLGSLGDKVSGINLTRDPGEEPGFYTIHASLAEGANPDYENFLMDGKLEIVDGVHHEKGDKYASGLIYMQDCWEETATGKYYADDYLEHEIKAVMLAYPNPISSTEGFTVKESASLDGVQHFWVAETTYGKGESGTRTVEFTFMEDVVSDARLVWSVSSISDPWHGLRSHKIYKNDDLIESYDQPRNGSINGGIFYIPLSDVHKGDKIKLEFGWGCMNGTQTVAACLEYTLHPEFYLMAQEAGSTVQLKKVGTPYEAALEYSTNLGKNWQSYTFGQTITLTDAGDRVFFRNASDEPAKGFSKGFNDYYQFVMTGSIAASGNVMSLIDKTCNSTTFPAESVGIFACLFSGCKSLTSAPNLPATELMANCYYWMFNGCTGLTSAPELPATTLASDCYTAMFDNCTGLKQAPALPAKTMEVNCYASMFRGCTSLAEAPELSAMTLADGCYTEMFCDCKSFETAPVLPASTLKLNCYYKMFSGCTSLTTAPELLATTLATSCYEKMFAGCTKLESAPELAAKQMHLYCYSGMFKGCTNLTTAPELPATTLAKGCYYEMFQGCTKLKQVKVGFTQWGNMEDTYANDYGFTKNWLSGVASTGTFVCPIGLDKTKTGASYIPEGWTICSPITISAAGMATLCLPFDAVCSEGVTAFYATAVDNEGVTFSPVNGGLIKADQGVLVKGDAGSYLVEMTTGAEAPTTNYMVGVTSETECPGTANYILVNGSEGVGFYRWDTGSLAAYKAYLPVHEGVTPSSSIAIRFDDGSTTIDDVISEPENEVIYDLQGRRVMNADKGLYIVNGKKVLKR